MIFPGPSVQTSRLEPESPLYKLHCSYCAQKTHSGNCQSVNCKPPKRKYRIHYGLGTHVLWHRCKIELLSKKQARKKRRRTSVLLINGRTSTSTSFEPLCTHWGIETSPRTNTPWPYGSSPSQDQTPLTRKTSPLFCGKSRQRC